MLIPIIPSSDGKGYEMATIPFGHPVVAYRKWHVARIFAKLGPPMEQVNTPITYPQESAWYKEIALRTAVQRLDLVSGQIITPRVKEPDQLPPFL